MKMLLTGDLISADEALRYGRVSDVVDSPALMELATAYAEKIARAAPLSIQAAKRRRRPGGICRSIMAFSSHTSFGACYATQKTAKKDSRRLQKRATRTVGALERHRTTARIV